MSQEASVPQMRGLPIAFHGTIVHSLDLATLEILQNCLLIVDSEGKIEKIHKDVVYEKEKYPEDLTEPTEPKIELNAAPATRLHMLNFLDAIDKNSRPVADIEEGHISTASCILANMSMKTGRPMVYDPQKRVVVGDKEATALLQRPYRQPWVHPDPNKV